MPKFTTGIMRALSFYPVKRLTASLHIHYKDVIQLLQP